MNANVPKKLALLVGVADYGNDKDNLPFCKNDVSAMQRVLSRKGFTSSSRVSLPLRPIIDQGILRDMVAGAPNSDDTVLFYFSGHGIDVSGEQILQGKDGKLTYLERALNEADLLLLSDILDILSKTPAQKLIIIDACRVGKPLNDNEVKAIQPLLRERRKTIQQLQNCVIAFASADGQESFGLLSGEASRFTSALVAELREYGRDFLGVVRETLIRLRAGSHPEAQTPWLYASTSDNRPIDQFRILEQEAGRDDGGWIRLIAPTESGSRGINHLGRLVQFDNEKWKTIGEITGLSKEARQLEMSVDGQTFAVLSKNSIYFGSINPPELASNSRARSKLESTRIGPSSLAIFGITLSPSGKLIAAFGTPYKTTDVGLKAWKIDSAGGKSEIELVNIPTELQCNSALFVNEDHLYAAFSAKDGTRISIWRFDRDSLKSWKGAPYYPNLKSRITAIAIDKKNRALYFGAQDGSITKHSLAPLTSLEFIPRKHPCANQLFYGKRAWISNEEESFGAPIAVRSIAILEEQEVVGITYYDSTISFFDTALSTYIASFNAERNSRHFRIIVGGIDWLHVPYGTRIVRFNLDNHA